MLELGLELAAARPRARERVGERGGAGAVQVPRPFAGRLQQRLASVTIIDESMSKAIEGLVVVGTTVKMRDVDNSDEDLFRLVGEASANPPFDYVEVTATSPMGQAMLKSRVGDTIRVDAPRGVKRFMIVEIV